MKISGYHHIGLKVTDAEKSREFYVDGLGGQEIHRFTMGNTGKIIYLIDLGENAVVEIIPTGSEEDEANARWAHIALRTDDARVAYDMALKAGAKPRVEPKDGNLGGMEISNAFVTGPDGEDIEFFEIK